MALTSQRQLFLQHLAQTSETPMMVEIERADGVYLYGPDGKRYIDLISGISVSALGHNHPTVVEAVKNQVDKHMHVMVYGEFIQSPQVKLAKALSDTLPEPLDSCFFVNSGSEAIEGAMKLAKRYTGRNEIIACKNAYHGSTHGALSLSNNDAWKMAFLPLLPGIIHIEFGSEEDLNLISDKTAAIIIETIQGEAGVVKAGAEYFHALRKRCHETGTLLIVDEIQTGFGRTGTFWGFEHYDFVPDVVVSAKALGGGMPLGAFIASREVMSSLSHDPILGHITTFGGHPVSAAASLATLEYLQKTRLFREVEKKASVFIRNLHHPKIQALRHAGLLMAVEFDSFEVLLPIIHKAAELGLITDWFLYCNNSLRIAPPLIITEQQIEEAVDILLRAIDLA